MLPDIPKGTHMCLIFSDRSSAMRDAAEFLMQAARDGGVGQYFAYNTSEEEIKGVFEDVDAHAYCQHKDRLQWFKMDSLYYPGGHFDKNRMLGLLQEKYLEQAQQADALVHYAGEMQWALDFDENVLEDVIDFENRVNSICQHHPFSSICQYDATRFSPETLVEVMRVHPYMLVDGMVVPSPNYGGGAM